MDLQLKFQQVNEIEKQGLSIFEIEGINWWPLIRIYLFQMNVVRKEDDRPRLIYPKRVWWELIVAKERYKEYKNKSIHDVDLSDVETCFITHSAHYKLNKSESFINRFLDPLFISTKKRKTIFLIGELQKGNYECLPNSLDVFAAKLLLRTQIKNVISAVFFAKRPSTYYTQRERKFSKMIDYIHSFDFFKEYNFDALAGQINGTMLYYECAKILFKKIKPKDVILCVYYGFAQYGITLAANQMGIKSIDYQHGIQNGFHYAYGKWSNVPSNGYNLLPSEFWVYSPREEKNLLSSFSNTSHKVRVVGNFWVKYWKNKSVQYEAIEWIKSLKKNNYKIILFTVSNHLLEDTHFFWDILNWFEERKCFVLFRLHPRYLRLKTELEKKLAQLNFTNYDIDNATKTELYDILLETDVHITQNSTVAEEALYFGLRTIIIEKEWRVYFEEYIQSAEMYLPYNLTELSVVLTKLLAGEKLNML